MPNFPDYQVNLLRKIVELYSPTGKENEVAQLLVEEMRSLGLSCRIDEVGNAVGEFAGDDPTFLLCGHMDTVPGQLPVKLEGGKLYGRGAVDAKSALAAMISTAGLLIAEDFPGKIVVVGAVDEEGEGKGVKKLIESGVRADYGIFGEPSGVEGITIAYKGSCHLRVICKTKTGHSSAPWLFHNAVDMGIAFWRELQKIHFIEEKTDSKFYSLTSTITSIQGGGSSSTVPSLCELHADFRLPPAIPLKRFLEEVSRVVEYYRVSHSGVELLVDVDDSCEPFEADRNSTLVRGLAWAIRSIRGRPAMLLRKTGTGDMNVLGAFFHVPMVTYGPGDSKLDHTEDEHIDLKEYSDSIKILREGLIRTLEFRNRSMRR